MLLYLFIRQENIFVLIDSLIDWFSFLVVSSCLPKISDLFHQSLLHDGLPIYNFLRLFLLVDLSIKVEVLNLGGWETPMRDKFNP